PLFDAVTGGSRFAAARGDDRHFLAVGWAAADIAADLAGRRHRHAPDEGAVGALDPAPREIARQRAVGGLGLGDDEEPARVLVETMHDPRPAHPADAGEALAAMRQQRIDQRALGVAAR